MEFRLLGPVEGWSNGDQIDLGTTKIRLLLTVLLMAAGHTVSLESLVHRVWGDEPPPKVLSSVQANLSRLRKQLKIAGASNIQLEHTASGYRLIVAAEDVDALEFTRIVVEGQAAAAGGERERAIRLLQTAEAMVRGTPLAGLPGDWAEALRSGLQERHRSATLTRIGLQLEQDSPQLLISELRELVGRYPLDQGFTALLMRALYSADRSADAIEVFQASRRRLRDQLGIDPSRSLRDLYQRILRGEELTLRRTHHPPPAHEAPPTPNTLERNPPGFVGRERNLEILRTAITEALQAGRSALCVIDGMPGVGKTAVALHLAHELRAQCPDGALQVDLRSHDPQLSPTATEAALRSLLSTLIADSREMQRVTSLDQALALWRRSTQDRRVLLLLDDVRDAEQIRPLLPNGPGNIVLVTCRRQLAELPGAVRHTLVPMRTEEARQLFFRGTAEALAVEDVPAINAIVKACGHLPLALSIAGALFRSRPTWTATDFAARLNRSLSGHGMDGMSESLNATFETSYRDLPELPRRMLRRLALYPGARISPYFAAVLVDGELFDAEFALDSLVGHHLLTEPRPHRYQLHDLVKTFAGYALARDDNPDEVRAAEERLVAFGVAATDQATARFHPHRHVNLASSEDTRLAVPSFATAHDAAEWLDEEYESLRLLTLQTLAGGRRREGGALAHMLATYLDRRCLWPEAISLSEEALRIWVRVEDARGQAHALGDLATAFWRIGSLDQARACSETALAIWTRLGDRDGQADALLELGRVHYDARNADEAIRCYSESAALRVQQHDLHGEAQALCHRGVVRFDAGDHSGGIADTNRALQLARKLYNAAIERNCLNNLGEFHRQRGEHEEALTCFRESMALAERVGDPRNIAVAALNLGELHTLIGQPHEALTHLDAALASFTKLGTRSSIVNTLLAQVRTYVQLHDFERAGTCLEHATTAAAPLVDPLIAARVHLTGGALYLRQQDYEAALAEYRSALARARRAHAILEQAIAHRGIADTQAAMGARRSLAKAHWQKAAELYAGIRPTEAQELRARLGHVSAAEPDELGGAEQQNV